MDSKFLKFLFSLILIVLVLAILPGIIPVIGKSLSNAVSTLFWEIVSWAGGLPGKVLKALNAAYVTSLNNYRICLYRELQAAQLQDRLKAVCPNANPRNPDEWEACLVKAFQSDNQGYPVESCRQNNLVAGFFPTLVGNTVCKWNPLWCR